MMDITQAEKVLAHLGDHIVSKPMNDTGQKMFDAIQMVILNHERLDRIVTDLADRLVESEEVTRQDDGRLTWSASGEYVGEPE